ncbi:nucleotidyltransferase family protein [Francisella frigiditurris]|uniref:Nucleotidyl transferase family protein n=1 Tax=Francisella frigiditurris TaxID=1542390 RepID=A0A1J0KUU6_9GAMM|nr:nucleotidyltransferase family protein [Francisella frigiditurris]APC97529.1 nucleotidyl transferase family protein [Francisella frigiditurris]
MKAINSIKIGIDATIREAWKVIDSGAMQIALVVDDSDKLIGTLTDGDIRRGFLNGLNMDSSIETIVFRTPITSTIGEAKEDIVKKATLKKIHQIPVVDDKNTVIGLHLLDELSLPQVKPNRVILMVGGLGTRLRPLTNDTPKPMLHVGEKPILQTIVESFVKYGYINITMCVNYKSHLIQDHFSDGSSFGANIEYIFEQSRMGTAGALTLLKEKPLEPFFVMNGDLLTNVNFESLNDYHRYNLAMATMCVREYDFQVPYGVVKMEGNNITSIQEKPVHSFYASAGIYMLSPEAIDYIPQNQFYDMPTLFEKLISAKEKTISFPLKEYWLDIGRIDEYKKANDEYNKVF